MSLSVGLTKNTLGQGLPLTPRVVQRTMSGFPEVPRMMATDTALGADDMGDRFHATSRWPRLLHEQGRRSGDAARHLCRRPETFPCSVT